MDANIVLTGFMGTGKSSVGRLLAAATGRTFIDTDDLIEERSGRTIADIFATEGEPAFRALEREIARELAHVERGLVIATGGRFMLDPANAAAVGTGARVFCLTAEPEEIVRRIRADAVRRPLLDVDNAAGRVHALLEERAAAYRQYPQIPTDGRQPEAVAGDILSAIQHEPATLTVTHPAGQYDVRIGRYLLPRWRDWLAAAGAVAVITDTNVGQLYAAQLGPVAAVITIPAGEQHKTLETVRSIYEQLLAAGLDRSGCIIALGGGVVGDVAGFVAATYMRGLPLLQCPTSLLAMVDASVGGKSGVDLPQGKNLVGAFKQPVAVLADVATLRTLPPAEFAAGLAEVVKHGLIAAPHLLERIEREDWTVVAADDRPDELQALIVEAIRVKRDVVQADPFEHGRRAVLNLGHTFGHAIEQASGYRVRHGEAVAMGLVAAAHLSARLGHCDPALQGRIEQALTRCQLPTRIPAGLQPQTIYEAMFADKKKTAGQLRFILLRDVGEVFVSGDVPAGAVLDTLTALRYDL